MATPVEPFQPTDDVEPIRAQIDSAIDGLEPACAHPDDAAFLAELRAAARGQGLELPQLPEDLARVRLVIADPNTGARDLARAIRHNPVIAAQFVGLANSAYYSGQHRVEHVDEAVVRVGMKQAVALVTAIVAKASLFFSVGYRHQAKEIFRHSLATAVNAQLIADMTFPERSADAFVTGLVHDFGRVYVLAIAGGQDADRSADRGAPTPGLLERASDALHPGFSALIARDWAFDRAFVAAVLDHHAELGPMLEGETDELRLTRILKAADHLGHRMIDAAFEAEDMDPNTIDLLSAFETIDDLLEDAQDAYAAFDTVLS